jgi:hypothetical protein
MRILNRKSMIALVSLVTCLVVESAGAQSADPLDGIGGPNGLVAPRSSRPQNQPATQPVESIRALLKELEDDAPDVRDRARTKLLQLTPGDLPTLRRLVAAGEASRPAQRDALYDIVRHVYLTGDRPPPAPEREAFFGVNDPMPNTTIGDKVVGLAFKRRLLGFPAFGALQEGDLIIGISGVPGLEEETIDSIETLKSLRQVIPPGMLIRFRVVRDSTLIDVPIRLAETPGWAGRGDIPAMLRLERADAYWDQNFEPAFAGPAS